MLRRQLQLMFLHWDIPINCLDFQTLPSIFFLQMLKGYSKLSAHLNSPLPVTLPILHKIIEAASRFSCLRYEVCQFQAMCTIAFYAFLRVSEMTSTTRHGPPLLQIHQIVKLVNDSNGIVSLKLTFSSSTVITNHLFLLLSLVLLPFVQLSWC